MTASNDKNITKIIHINRQVIQHNAKYNKQLPVCRIQIGSVIKYSMGVNIQGPSRMIYSPNKPQPCGAKVWIETESKLELINEKKWSEIKKDMKLK